MRWRSTTPREHETCLPPPHCDNPYLGLPRGFLYIILKIIIKPKFYQTTIAPILRQSFQAHYLPTFPT